MCLQWVCGLLAFLFPKLGYGARTLYMPHHVFWGLAILGLAVAAALTGIMEKAWFMNFGKDSTLYVCLRKLSVYFLFFVEYIYHLNL